MDGLNSAAASRAYSLLKVAPTSRRRAGDSAGCVVDEVRHRWKRASQVAARSRCREPYKHRVIQGVVDLGVG